MWRQFNVFVENLLTKLERFYVRERGAVTCSNFFELENISRGVTRAWFV